MERRFTDRLEAKGQTDERYTEETADSPEETDQEGESNETETNTENRTEE